MTTSLQAAIHCSLDAIFQQFFSRVVDFMFLQVALQVRREFQRLSEFQVLHDWFSFSGEPSHYPQDTDFEDFASMVPNVDFALASKASFTIQQTPGMLQFGASTQPSASAGPIFGLPFLGTGLTFTQRTVSICVRTQGNFGPCGHSEVEFSLHCWVTLQLPFLFVCSITMSLRKSATWTVFVAVVTFFQIEQLDTDSACHAGLFCAWWACRQQLELTRDLIVSAVQTNAFGLEEIRLQTTAARCRGYCQFSVRQLFYLSPGYFEHGGIFYRQQPPEMKLIMPVLGQHWNVSTERTMC